MSSHKTCVVEIAGLCPSLQRVEIASSRCADAEEHKEWWEEEWRDGEACREECNNYAKIMGPGCCEASPRNPTDILNATRSHCRFHLTRRLTNGYSDTKATICTGNYCVMKNPKWRIIMIISIFIMLMSKSW